MEMFHYLILGNLFIINFLKIEENLILLNLMEMYNVGITLGIFSLGIILMIMLGIIFVIMLGIVRMIMLDEILMTMLDLTISQTVYQQMSAHFMKTNGLVFVGRIFISVIMPVIANPGAY